MGADVRTLKTAYKGSVRPVLEYGMSATATAAKTHFDRLSRVQNQASRLITGGIKSTPILALESATGLQTLEDRRDIKILTQSAKFKSMPDHPMKERMTANTRHRIKRSNFIQQSRLLENESPELQDKFYKEPPRCLANPI